MTVGCLSIIMNVCMLSFIFLTGHNFAKKKTRSREEILCDCHKLLVELLKENPDGFNMCTFKPAFIQKYGYILDHQMLGYPKLASLLNIMPGVRLESSFILPAGKFLFGFRRQEVGCG